MTKLYDPEDSVSMRLLNGSTTAVGDDDEIESHDGSRQPFPGLSRTPSPDFHIARLRRRRVLIHAFYGVLLLTIVGLLILVSRTPIVEKVQSWHMSVASALSDHSPIYAFSDHSMYVAGAPSARFRDNLVNGTRYVTSWPIGGFTNQVMAQINLVYLAVLALRTPVLGDFVPGHMHGNPGILAVSEVYDLPRLADSLRMPILEWSEFKNRSPPHETEYLGCWSPHSTIFKNEGHYATEIEFGLDISLTPVPDSRPKGSTENMQNIMALASLGWPEARADALQHTKPLPSPTNKVVIQPDETMLCFDELYYADSVKAYEWPEEWVPMWTQVGKYLRWEPKMENLARSYIMRAFGLSASDPFPTYISVHIRHTDFASLCHDPDRKPESCFPPLSAYAEKVEEVRMELLAVRGMNVESVFVASDEEDRAWWALVEERGWRHINWEAEGTEAMYSEWYPIVLDSLALSLGKGFVGTTRSTLSLLASKRVQDWEDGFVRELTLNI